MNAVERALDHEMTCLLDRLSASVPAGTVTGLAKASPTLGPRVAETEARLAEIRATVLAEYGRWRLALDDLENLWALASWRSTAAQEPVEQTTTLAA